MERIDLNGRSAIVTGGGTGIGQAIAIALGHVGTRVVVCGRRCEPIETVVEAINRDGGEALAIQANVASEDDVRLLVDETVSVYGSVDILINNAGVSGSGQIHEHDINTWDQTIAVNLRGPFLLCRFVLPLMRSKRGGHIVNISSEGGLEYYQGSGAYGVSKHALNTLGEYIQRENQDHGIRVDTVCPGMVVTPMSDQAHRLNREKCLMPEDVADLVMWLLTRRQNVKIGRQVLIQTMENPWK